MTESPFAANGILDQQLECRQRWDHRMKWVAYESPSCELQKKDTILSYALILFHSFGSEKV